MLKSQSDSLIGHIGVLGAVLGLIGGLALMPVRTQPAGALSWSGVVLAMGLLAGAAYDMGVRGIGRAIRAEYLIMLQSFISCCSI